LEECFNKILKIIISEKKGIKQESNMSEVEKKVKELIE